MKQELTEENINNDFLAKHTLSNKTNVRSDLVDEFISTRSGFLEEWSLFIFLIIMLLLLGATWFVDYPDIIETSAVVTGDNAPKEILAKKDGRLLKLYVHNKDEVKKNQIIGWIEGTADFMEVDILSRRIDSAISALQYNKANRISLLMDKHYRRLGEIQPAFQQFLTSLRIYDDYLVNGFFTKRKTSLLRDISSLDTARTIIQTEKKINDKDLELAKESFKMNQILLERNIITKEEFRNQTSRYLSKELNIPNIKRDFLSNEAALRSKTSEISQLNHDLQQQRTVLLQNLQSLKSVVDDWIQAHSLLAPMNGKIFFNTPLQENQYILSNKILGYVNPLQDVVYAQTTLAQSNFGKLDTGMNVQLRFDAYPYQEHGFVTGKINYISEIPSDSGFYATIKLSNGLRTNENFQIPFKNGLTAHSIIITKEMRLFMRIYYMGIKFASIGKK